VRALVVPARGAPPERAEVPGPAPAAGRALVAVRAASVNPVDLAIAAGRFYLPVPDPPYVPGAEGVGEVVASDRHPPGTRVWCLAMTGCLAEAVSAPAELVAPVPDELDDATASGLGIAGLAGWMAVRERGGLRPGETVVVLGAGGVVGQVAVQAARALGAGRVVAGARDQAGRERALRAGADAAIPTGPGLAEALREACPDGADLVVDPLWGSSAAAALGAMRRGGRLVQVGNAESPVAEVAAGPLRGGRIDVRGISLFSEDPADVVGAYADLAAAAARGEVRLAIERVDLDGAPAAWARQAAGPGGVKLVVTV
jgi:NADPH:quinone reductase-like Zn-dependent oxidoreductase